MLVMQTPTAPDLVKQFFAPGGGVTRTGPRGSRENKVRAGHARAAQVFRQLAADAIKLGDKAQARKLVKRAQEQEKLALPQ